MPSTAPRAILAQATTLIRIAASAAIAMAAFMLVWWNESDAVVQSRAFGNAPSEVVSLERPVSEPVNEGRLVHVSGTLKTRIAPQDTDLDIVFDGALVVQRVVEVWQWTPASHGSAYTSVQAWSPDTALPPSPSPSISGTTRVTPVRRIASQVLTVGDASLGDFKLSPEILARLDAPQPLPAPQPPAGWIRDGNALFLGLDPKHPRLGDIRISYRKLPLATPVSIIARQGDGTLSPYALANGTDLMMISTGIQSPATMLAAVDTLRAPSFLVVRLGAAIAMAIGLFCALCEARLLLAGQGHLARLTPAGTAQVAAAATTGACLTSMAIAWLFSLPFAAATVLLACSAGLILAGRGLQNRGAALGA